MGNSDLTLIDAMIKPERLATTIAQLPSYEGVELAELVAAEQKPGSFGELVKNALGLIDKHKAEVEQAGSNVVSFYQLRGKSEQG